ncbi:MAG: coenzyme F420 hydrogenase [Candidatus Rokuibacteriota bacterium]|nr:MAG: coenzyme F420 hydrogenase [Candidatus Rokubacteria bacterium]
MRGRIQTLQDVVDWGLCVGCGACYYACPDGGVSLVNIEAVGIRPRFDSPQCASCTECLSICPGYSVNGEQAIGALPKRTEADHEFGPALEIWEGCATDPEIRYKGSSGGILSALALYCLEHEDMAFVLHAGMNEAEPWKNQTVQSWSKHDIMSRTGSRYAPASPCEGLLAIEQSDRPCVFIGKPCDATAAMALRRTRPGLDRKLGLVMTFFCAGTPSTEGTLDLVKTLDFSLEQVGEVRYRGEGWPGRFRVRSKDQTREGSYGASSDPGRSIVIVRTRRGQEILHRAMSARYVELAPIGASPVLSAQTDLLARRRELFGRLLAMKLLLMPTPRFAGFSLLRSWIRLPLLEKARTVLGTLRRLVRRGLWRRRPPFAVAVRAGGISRQS